MICLKNENGIVTNAALFDGVPEGWVVAPNGVGIGYIDNGDGSYSAPPKTPLTTLELESEGRDWRNAQLSTADNVINTLEDGLGAFNATEWRAYRIALREWPTTTGFPLETSRPVAPE